MQEILVQSSVGHQQQRKTRRPGAVVTGREVHVDMALLAQRHRVQLELLALPILAAGWILYTVSLILADPDPVLDWPVSPVMLGFSFIVACVVRLSEVLYVVQRTRRNVDALPEELRP